MSSVQLRRAIAADADRVADVWLRSRHAAGGLIPPAAHPDAEVREWIRDHLVTDTDCWVAERTPGGQIVGMLALEDDWIDQLYVDPDAQGQGVGTALVALAKREAAGTPLQLWTFETNTPAQRFYERHGFVCAERTGGAANEERAPDRRYVYTPVSR